MSEPITGEKLFLRYKRPFRVRTILRCEMEDLREGFRQLRTIVTADRIKSRFKISINVQGN